MTTKHLMKNEKVKLYCSLAHAFFDKEITKEQLHESVREIQNEGQQSFGFMKGK